jgi:hypothetical protein
LCLKTCDLPFLNSLTIANGYYLRLFTIKLCGPAILFHSQIKPQKMQKKIIATIAVASVIITGISCKWFASKATDKTAFSLVGKWQVDTVVNNGKSSVAAALSSAMIDSNYVFKFNADSTVNMLSPKDSSSNYYYLQADTLFVKQDTAFVPYLITKTNDSLIAITSKDSLAIILKRQ